METFDQDLIDQKLKECQPMIIAIWKIIGWNVRGGLGTHNDGNGNILAKLEPAAFVNQFKIKKSE